MKRGLPTSVTQLLIGWRYPLLVLSLLVVVAGFLIPTDVDFDRKVANMISDRSGVLEPFLRLKRSFGGNEIVLAVYEDPGLLAEDQSGVNRLRSIRETLESVDGVRSALSLDKLSTRWIPISSQSNPYAIRMRDLFEGYTHNADGTIAVVVCMLLPEEETEASRRDTIDGLRTAIQNLPDGLSPGMLTGEPVMLVDGFRFVEQDGHRLGRWSTVLLGLTLLICFRSIRWMLICVAVVQLSLLLTRLTMAVLGMRMSMVSSMLTAVVTVVAVATVVHLIVRYTDARNEGRSPIRSLALTIRILLVPVAWACVTDAVGFGALKSASVGPVGDFGIMMGISCIAVLISVWILVPTLATIPFFDKKSGKAKTDRSVADTPPENRLRTWLHQFADLVERRSGTFGLFSVVIVVFSLLGLQFLEVETDFTRNFRRGAEIVDAYKFVEQKLGGAGVGDILVPAPETLSWEYLRHVRRFEDQLMAESVNDGPTSGLTKALSLADAVLVIKPTLSLTNKSTMLSEAVAQGGLYAMKERIPSFYAALHAEDPEAPGNYYLRIMFRAREQQNAEQKRRIISRVREVGQTYFGDQQWGQPTQRLEVTGFYVLLTALIDNIVGDQYTTFLLAVGGIGLTMLIAFRSVRLALIALIPNALPVLVVSGLMGWISWAGWFEFRINMGSAMIAAVSLGLSIDSSIHYIFAFQRARKLGSTVRESIRAAHGTVGLSMIFSTLALIVGFSVLATSNFTPTVYFGSLVSLAMLGGLLGNLVILPVLLRMVIRES